MPAPHKPEVAESLPVLQAMAEAGLSMSQAARRLGVTRNTVTGRARDYGIRFRGQPPARVGGCDSAQARKGWETRRARAAHDRSA